MLAEARRSASSLAVCETRARHAPTAHRNLNFRRCATAPLARTDGFARANSRMLTQLAATGGPTTACRGRVLTLSESANALAFIARETLLTLDAPFTQVLAASRGIRAQARDTLTIARAPDWRDTCKARPPAAFEQDAI